MNVSLQVCHLCSFVCSTSVAPWIYSSTYVVLVQFLKPIFSFFSPDGHCSLADNWNTANLLCLLLQQPRDAFCTEYRVPQITNRCLKSNKSVTKQLLLEALTQVSSCAVGPDARRGVSLNMLRDRKTCRLWDRCHNVSIYFVCLFFHINPIRCMVFPLQHHFLK